MATTLPTSFPPPPAYPPASVPTTDPAWVDYHTKLNQYVAKLAAYAAQIAVAAQPSTSTTGS
jgi:hypothetical protein